jgi:hypothetical protein
MIHILRMIAFSPQVDPIQFDANVIKQFMQVRLYGISTIIIINVYFIVEVPLEIRVFGTF